MKPRTVRYRYIRVRLRGFRNRSSYTAVAEWRELEQAMKQFPDGGVPALEDDLLYYRANHLQTVQAATESTFFDTCLVLSVVFCVLELAVQLLRAETFLQLLALILGVTIWAALAITIEFLEFSIPRRFHVLCTTALLSNLLLLASGFTSTSLGLSMYAVDCLMKCVLVMLILHASMEQSPRVTDTGGV
jgi:hypothetical protein